MQQLVCDATGGVFRLTFYGVTTPPIAAGATTSAVKAALQAISTCALRLRSCCGGVGVCGPIHVPRSIGDVLVSGGATACASGGASASAARAVQVRCKCGAGAVFG